MKVIAFYLPQYHAFPENDKWWGKGFTEWTNVKKAVPLYKNHYEPRVPLNNNYYNLLDSNTFKWQIGLAHKYGVYGFCFYHYWFSGKILMKKPMEMFLENKKLNQHFCISWANETWSRRWDGRDQDILIEQRHGDKSEWEQHFYYLLPFFKDERYILVDGKPLFILYKPEIFPEYLEMFKLWNDLAKKEGLKGLTFAIQSAIWNNSNNYDHSKVDYRIMFEPGFTGLRNKHSFGFKLANYYCKIFKSIHNDRNISPILYKAYCSDILNRKVTSSQYIPGMFVNWDNTPRKGKNGSTTLGNTPELFEKTFSKLIVKTKEEYHKDIIFINAWNEWAEGCYLEPDEKYKYTYLEAVKKALIDNNEFPNLTRI